MGRGPEGPVGRFYSFSSRRLLSSSRRFWFLMYTYSASKGPMTTQANISQPYQGTAITSHHAVSFWASRATDSISFKRFSWLTRVAPGS